MEGSNCNPILTGPGSADSSPLPQGPNITAGLEVAKSPAELKASVTHPAAADPGSVQLPLENMEEKWVYDGGLGRMVREL